MNIPTIILLAGIGIWLVASVRYLIKGKKRNACTGCCSNCPRQCNRH